MSMLSDKERDELLIRLDERIQKVREDMVTLKGAMSSDDGFTRCQLHGQKMNDIEQSLKWTKRGVWAAVLSVAIKFGFDKISPYLPG